jgi:hypothetical protein
MEKNPNPMKNLMRQQKKWIPAKKDSGYMKSFSKRKKFQAG